MLNRPVVHELDSNAIYLRSLEINLHHKKLNAIRHRKNQFETHVQSFFTLYYFYFFQIAIKKCIMGSKGFEHVFWCTLSFNGRFGVYRGAAGGGRLFYCQYGTSCGVGTGRSITTPDIRYIGLCRCSSVVFKWSAFGLGITNGTLFNPTSRCDDRGNRPG